MDKIKKTFTNISLIKIIACVMITILHIIGNEGSHLQICIYLIGSFGIPLFFMVNGYLLYDRNFTWAYYKKKAVKCLTFFLLWTVTLGAVKAVFAKSPMEIVKVVFGAVIGKDILYHLWFLITLLLLYTICFLVQSILSKKGGKLLKDFVGVVPMIVMLVLMGILFLLSIISRQLGIREIRDLIPVSFRLITFGGFYYMGMFIHKYEDILLKKCTALTGILTLAGSFAFICGIMWLTGLIWASSYYSSIFVAAGCFAIFVLLTRNRDYKQSEQCIQHLAGMTTGIWIIHPLVLMVFTKVLSHTGIAFSLPVRLLALVIIDVLCYLIVWGMQKIKFVRRYVAL